MRATCVVASQTLLHCKLCACTLIKASQSGCRTSSSRIALRSNDHHSALMLHPTATVVRYGYEIFSNGFWNGQRSFSVFHQHSTNAVCTLSATSFCHNPLKILPHTMFVKWWRHAKSSQISSSLEVILIDFQFHGRFAQKYITKCIIFIKWSRNCLKF